MTRTNTAQDRTAKRPRVQATVTFTGQRALDTGSLKWSSEGRLALVTAHNIHIVTPCFALHPSIKPTHFMSTYPADESDSAVSKQAFPYAYASIQPAADTSTAAILDTFREPPVDAGMALPATERPPVRGAEWSPHGMSQGDGQYLSVLTTYMQLSLWEATPNAWTGSWKQAVILEVPHRSYPSKRESFLDSHIVGASSLDRTRTKLGPTDMLPAGDNTIRFKAGSSTPAPTISIEEPDDGNLQHQSPPQMIQGYHSITYTRFLPDRRLVLATAGQVDVVLLKTSTDPAVRRFVLDPAASSSTDIEHVTMLHQNRLRATLSDGGIYDLNLSQGEGRASPAVTMVPPSSEVLTIHLEGQAEDGLQEQISLIRPFTGFATCSSPPHDHLPRLIAVSQNTSELASITRRVNERRQQMVCLMLTGTLNRATAGPEQEDAIRTSLDAMLGRGAGSNQQDEGPYEYTGIVQFVLSSPEMVRLRSQSEAPPAVAFSPLLSFFLSADPTSQDGILSSIWLSLQPYVGSWVDTASTAQLRRLHWLIIWLQRNNATGAVKNIKAGRVRLRELIGRQYLHAAVDQAATELASAPLSIATSKDELNFYLRLAAMSWFDAQQNGKGTHAADACLKLLKFLQPADGEASHTLISHWEEDLAKASGTLAAATDTSGSDAA
ncbi:hypothetical protein OC835_002562 [Tilletia horrida]|nr:hypothetical protein OC835_002562 [Tilletia horrida]